MITPTDALPPVMPFTLQITAVFELPVTVAEYCDAVPSVTLVAPVTTRFTAEPGPLPPEAGGGAVRSTARPSETDGSAMLVAAIVILEDWGALVGAG